MTELTDELKAAFIAAAGWEREPWRFNSEVADGLAAVLAANRRDQRAQVEAEAAAERERIRQLLGLPLFAAVRCVPDGRIQSGCVIRDGKTVRERVKAAYRAAFLNDQDGRS